MPLKLCTFAREKTKRLKLRDNFLKKPHPLLAFHNRLTVSVFGSRFQPCKREYGAL